MTLVKALQIAGLQIWFYSNDHEPAHFHVKKRGEWEIKVKFLLEPDDMIEVCWNDKNIPNRTLRDICSRAKKERSKLLAEWQAVQEK